MLRQSKGWGERFGIGRRRTAREDFSRGIVLTPADNPQAELLIFNVRRAVSPHFVTLAAANLAYVYSTSLQGDGQRCILSEDDSQFVLALDAPSSPEERLSRAVLIGTSDDGSLSSLIRLRFPECNMTGRFQLQNMCESQIILGGIEYRFIFYHMPCSLPMENGLQVEFALVK